MNKLDHVVTNNIKNKNKCHDPKFDNKFSLSGWTKYPLPVVTVSLRKGNKHRADIIYGLTFICNSEDTNSMIKRRHAKPYECKVHSNKAECSTAARSYCTTHDAKVPFCMPYFSSSNMILQHFIVDNNEDESGIGCDMIMGRDPMAQIILSVDFKHQFLQWYGDTVRMKETSGMLGEIYITCCYMFEVVIYTAVLVSTG